MTFTSQRTKRRILIVDDNHDVHEAIRKSLDIDVPKANPMLRDLESALFDDSALEIDQPPAAPFEFEVESAFQGEEAIRLVSAPQHASAFYLAFVDVRMPPGIDGIQTIKQLWKHAPGLYVVICTAHSDYNTADIMDELGPSPQLLVLRKPFQSIEIRQIALTVGNLSETMRAISTWVATLEERMAGMLSASTQQEKQLWAVARRCGRPALQIDEANCLVSANDELLSLLRVPAAAVAERPVDAWLRLGVASDKQTDSDGMERAEAVLNLPSGDERRFTLDVLSLPSGRRVLVFP